MKTITLEECVWEIKDADGSVRTGLSVEQVRKLWQRRELDEKACIRIVGTKRWLNLLEVDLFKRIFQDRRTGKITSLFNGLAHLPYLIFGGALIGYLLLLASRLLDFISMNPDADVHSPAWWGGIAGLLVIAFLIGFAFQVGVHRIQGLRWTVRELVRRECRRAVSLICLVLCVGSFLVQVFVNGSTGEKVDGAPAGDWVISAGLSLLGIFFWICYSVLKGAPTFRAAAPEGWVPEGVQLRESRFRSRILARLLRAAPMTLALATFPALIFLMRSNLEGWSPVALFFVLVLAWILIGVLWIQLRAFASRLESGSPLFLLRSDPRPPAVYLRNFYSDDQSFGVLGSIGTEAMLGDILSRNVGPFVAVGRPGEWIPSLGADRIYIESADRDGWKRVVEKLIDESGVVVFSAELNVPSSGGEVEAPEGFKWEISQALDRAGDRMALVVGKKGYRESYARFRKAFNPLFEERLGTSLPETVFRDSVILIRGGQPEVLRDNFSIRTMLGVVLGLTRRGILIWEQIDSRARWTGYRADKDLKRAPTRSGKTILLACLASLPMALPIPGPEPEVNLWVCGAVLFLILVHRFRRTMAESGVPRKQWKPESEVELQAPMVRNRGMFQFLGITLCLAVALLLVGLFHLYYAIFFPMIGSG